MLCRLNYEIDQPKNNFLPSTSTFVTNLCAEKHKIGREKIPPIYLFSTPWKQLPPPFGLHWTPFPLNSFHLMSLFLLPYLKLEIRPSSPSFHPSTVMTIPTIMSPLYARSFSLLFPFNSYLPTSDTVPASMSFH